MVKYKELLNFSVSRFLLGFKYEKTFRDPGSGFVVMKAFIDWHKKYVEWWKKKLKISNYGIFWISFIKGLIIGLLIYHFFIK